MAAVGLSAHGAIGHLVGTKNESFRSWRVGWCLLGGSGGRIDSREEREGGRGVVGGYVWWRRGCVGGDGGDGPRWRRTKASRAGMASQHGRAAAAGAEGAVRHGCCVRRLGLREGERGVVRLVELPRGNGQSITWRWHTPVIVAESSFPVSTEPGISSSTTPSILHVVQSQLLGPITRIGTVRLDSEAGYEDFRSEHALSFQKPRIPGLWKNDY